MIHIGFTGTQQGMTQKQKDALFVILRDCGTDFIFHHGDCLGADEEAHEIVRPFQGNWIVIHPPINEIKRAWFHGDEILKSKEYLVRNHDIVDACEVLIAAPKTDDEELRSGTWATVRYARKQRRVVIILSP